MLELPETISIGNQLNEAVVGTNIRKVYPPSKIHKLCWYNGDPAQYDEIMRGCKITKAEGFGIVAEMSLENGKRINFSDGVNVRLVDRAHWPENYQLLIELDNEKGLVFTVGMYGGISLHGDEYDNKYYLLSKAAVEPFSGQFEAKYRNLLANSKPNLSAKAFLATEQRFPGIGNGVLQDILFAAGINPKRKIGTFTNEDQDKLLACVRSVLHEMIELGGRDTEIDLFGQPGGYKTVLSKKTVNSGCPQCHTEIIKEAYLGGSVYYCPTCQPL